jgi:hypothetical protein
MNTAQQASFLLFCMAALTCTSCATMQPIDRAVAVHNVFRSVLIDLDTAYVPVLAEADMAAQERAQGDAAVYLDALKPWRTAVEVLTRAKQTEQVMHAAITQAIATGQGAGVLHSTYACAAAAVDEVTLAFGVLPKGSPLYAAAFAIGVQLRNMADGAECEVTK